jgi:hypothetical protein
MRRRTIHATLIVNLMMVTASAQTDKQALPEYTNSVRCPMAWLDNKSDKSGLYGLWWDGRIGLCVGG